MGKSFGFRSALAGGALLILAVASAAVEAEAVNYPERPVTIITDAAAGSTPDIDARFVAEELGRVWGRQVVVLDRPGGNGSIATRAASDASNDGHTLFMPALSSFVALPGIASNIPIKLPRDFVPIGFTAANPMFIAVSPSLGITTLPQLIDLAKKEPGKVTFAVTGIGRVTQLTGELLQARAGISLLTVPYNAGPAAALADVIGGRVNMIIEGFSGVAASIKSGAITPIAVTSPERLPEFPDLPTVAEAIPGFAAGGWQVLVAPLGTPAPIIDKISVDLAKAMADPELKKKLASIGSYAQAMNAAEALAFVDKQQATWQSILEKISK